MDKLLDTIEGIKIKALKSIEPRNFRTWRRQAEFISQENSWDDRTSILKAFSSLQGPAEVLAARVPPKLPPKNSDAPCMTLAEYLDSLQLLFVPQSSQGVAENELKFAAQRPWETPDRWAARLHDLHCDALPGLTPDQRERYAPLIDIFIHGLLDTPIELVVERSNPDTLTEAIQFAMSERASIIARALRKNQPETLLNRPGVAYRPEGAEEQVAASSDDVTTINQLQQQQQKQNQPQSTSYRGQNVRRGRINPNISCHNCGRKGHIRRQCRLPKNRQRYRQDVQQRTLRYLRKSISMIENPQERDRFVALLQSEDNEVSEDETMEGVEDDLALVDEETPQEN